MAGLSFLKGKYVETRGIFVTCSTVGYGTYAYNMLLYLEHSITRGLYIAPKTISSLPPSHLRN
jgi:hypothetical protein